MLKRFRIDTFLVLLAGAVAVGILLPAQGEPAEHLKTLTGLAIYLLFFLYGAKLDPLAVRDALLSWKVQVLALASTFVMMPALGLTITLIVAPFLNPVAIAGLLFLSILPSTVQSSIAFTSIAKGNVPVAICAASVSNLLGVFLTPMLAFVLIGFGDSGFHWDAVLNIATQILLPFAIGQAFRPMIGGFVARHSGLTRVLDRGAILLIVYAAFSASTVSGTWQTLAHEELLALFFAVLLFLLVSIASLRFFMSAFTLPHGDRTALLYCGSAKSIATGLPIAAALYSPDEIGLIVLPSMIYHISQLLTCARMSQNSAGNQ